MTRKSKFGSAPWVLPTILGLLAVIAIIVVVVLVPTESPGTSGSHPHQSAAHPHQSAAHSVTPPGPSCIPGALVGLTGGSKVCSDTGLQCSQDSDCPIRRGVIGTGNSPSSSGFPNGFVGGSPIAGMPPGASGPMSGAGFLGSDGSGRGWSNSVDNTICGYPRTDEHKVCKAGEGGPLPNQERCITSCNSKDECKFVTYNYDGTQGSSKQCRMNKNPIQNINVYPKGTSGQGYSTLAKQGGIVQSNSKPATYLMATARDNSPPGYSNLVPQWNKQSILYK